MYFAAYRQIIRRSPIYRQVTRLISNETSELKPWTQIPGPKSYPFIGSLPMFLPTGEFYNLGVADIVYALYKKYGPIVKLGKILNKKPVLFLFDAEGAEQVYRGEDQMPIRPSLESLIYFRKIEKNLPPNTSTGLISENGKPWKEFRSTVNPVLMQPKIMKLYTSSLDEIASEIVDRLKSLRDEKNMVPNVDRLIYLWSLESIGVIALGRRLKCFDDNLDKDSPERQLTEVAEHLMRAFDKLDLLQPSIWKYYPTKAFKKARADFNKQEILASQFIDQAMKEFKSNPKPDDQKGVLEKLVDINKEVALIMATDLLLGGLDTATHAVLAALYLLASNCDKQSKLRAELKTNHEQRPYLKACVKEAMRLMPVVSATGRVTTREYNILGYRIPKDTLVCISNKDIARMDKYFVQPHDYIPERWIVEKDDPLCYKNAHRFAFNPFGFGSRTCIGRRIAELEMETLIEHLVRNFEMEWFGLPPKIEGSVVNYVKGPYNFIFKNAK